MASSVRTDKAKPAIGHVLSDDAFYRCDAKRLTRAIKLSSGQVDPEDSSNERTAMSKQQNLAIEYCGSRLNVSSAAVYDHISAQPDGKYRIDFRGRMATLPSPFPPYPTTCFNRACIHRQSVTGNPRI